MVPPWLAAIPAPGRPSTFGARAAIRGRSRRRRRTLRTMLKRCPAHRATPLYALPTSRRRLGLGDIRVKDESQRFGFGAFKALGGVLAVYFVLCRRGRRRPTARTELRRPDGGQAREDHRPIWSSPRRARATTAAPSPPAPSCSAIAAWSSCRSSPAPRRKPRSAPAAPRSSASTATTMQRSPNAAASPPRRAGRSSPTPRGRATITSPRSVMRGYTRAGARGDAQWRRAPTHVFVQAGVGGLAAAVIGYLWETMTSPAGLHRRRAGERRLLVPEQSRRPARAGQRQCRHGHGRARLPRDLAGHLAGDRPGADWFMTIERGQVAAGAQAARLIRWRRSGDRLGTRRAVRAWPA